MNRIQKDVLKIPEKVRIIETAKSLEIRDVDAPSNIKFDIERIFAKKIVPAPEITYALKIYRSSKTKTLYIALIDRRRKIAVKAPLHSPAAESLPCINHFMRNILANLEIASSINKDRELFRWVVSDSWIR